MSTSKDLLSHPLLSIIPCSNEHYHVFLHPYIEFEDLLDDKIYSTFKSGLGTKVKPLKCTSKELSQTIQKLDELIENTKYTNTPDSNNDSETEDDEETIQQVLKRRLKSESKHEIIEETNISDSEDEDVISTSRRLRNIYKQLQHLQNEINYLKQSKTI